jgi:hypothetical protein
MKHLSQSLHFRLHNMIHIICTTSGSTDLIQTLPASSTCSCLSFAIGTDEKAHDIPFLQVLPIGTGILMDTSKGIELQTRYGTMGSNRLK